jgi:type II secretory pathway pseudopilin PulG
MRAKDEQSDDGFTLVELIVAASLTVLVILVVGGLMYSGSTTERSVRTLTSATTAGQFAATNVEKSIRNSSAFQVQAVGADQFLVAKVAGSASALTWSCAAWYFSAADSTLRTMISSSAIALPTVAAQRSWTLLSGGLIPSGGTTVFLAGGSRLTITFQVDAGKGPDIVFRSSIASQTGQTGSAPCY